MDKFNNIDLEKYTDEEIKEIIFKFKVKKDQHNKNMKTYYHNKGVFDKLAYVFNNDYKKMIDQYIEDPKSFDHLIAGDDHGLNEKIKIYNEYE